MANEWVIRDRLENPVDMTCVDANGIEKGAALKLFDPRVASGAQGGESKFILAGICAREKIASDGRTQVAVFRRGIFDAVASGSIVIGAPLSIAEGNRVIASTVLASGATVIGHALETGTDGETIQVALNL